MQLPGLSPRREAAIFHPAHDFSVSESAARLADTADEVFVPHSRRPPGVVAEEAGARRQGVAIRAVLEQLCGIHVLDDLRPRVSDAALAARSGTGIGDGEAPQHGCEFQFDRDLTELLAA